MEESEVNVTVVVLFNSDKVCVGDLKVGKSGDWHLMCFSVSHLMGETGGLDRSLSNVKNVFVYFGKTYPFTSFRSGQSSVSLLTFTLATTT